MHKQHRFYFKLFHFKIFLKWTNSQKQLHIFFQKQSHIFFFNIFSEAAASSLKSIKYSQKQPHICIFTKNIQKQLHIFLISFRSSRTFLKKHEIFLEAATHTKKICSEAAAHALCKGFHIFSRVMKNIFDGY